MTADLERCIRWGVCYTCGEQLTRFRSSILSPADAMNQESGFPPSHLGCARKVAIEARTTVCIWTAREPSMPMLGQRASGEAAAFFKLPAAASLEWYADGREAFRDEVIMAIKAAIPDLLAACDESLIEFQALGRRVRYLVPTLPRQSSSAVRACAKCRAATDDPSVLGCTREDCALFPELVA